MLALGVIDDIVKEPLGGAHRNIDAALDALSASIAAQLAALNGMSGDKLISDRADKYIKIGDLSLTSCFFCMLKQPSCLAKLVIGQAGDCRACFIYIVKI